METALAKHGMTREQIDKMNVRNVLRDYMATPGATMETDVFVAMVGLIQSARREAASEEIRKFRMWAVNYPETVKLARQWLGEDATEEKEC